MTGPGSSGSTVREATKPCSGRSPGSEARRNALSVLICTAALGGGTGKHIRELTRLWSERGSRVEILTQRPSGFETSFPVPVHQLPAPDRWYHRSLVTQWRHLTALRRRIRSTRPDVLHCYFFWPIIYGRLLKSLGLVRTLVENREDEGFSWSRRDYALLRATRWLPDRVICVSDAVRRVARRRERLRQDQLETVHNGVNPDEKARTEASVLRREWGLDDGHLVVGMVANFNRAVKGVDEFLDVVPRIAAEVPEARFVLIGRGERETRLQEKAAELGIQDILTFAGFRSDIHACYEAMDLSVLTSYSEGLSITLLESMNHGLAVVATRVGGNPEVVVDGLTGFLVPPRRPDRFARAVVRLLKDGERRHRMGEAARARVRRNFTVDEVSARYMKIYRDVAERPDAD